MYKDTPEHDSGIIKTEYRLSHLQHRKYGQDNWWKETYFGQLPNVYLWYFSENVKRYKDSLLP